MDNLMWSKEAPRKYRLLLAAAVATLSQMAVAVTVQRDCEFEPTSERVLDRSRKEAVISLPKKGPVILESHYISKEDKIQVGSLKDGTDRISEHIKLSCEALRLDDQQCKKKYKNHFKSIWNGTDGGAGGPAHAIGGTALHHIDKTAIPSLEEEMSLANIRWYIDGNLRPTSPPKGTKYLVRYGSKARVVAVGYEHGPPPKDGFLGLGPEAFDQLGLQNGFDVTIGRLKDQNIPLGPVNCLP
jgi:hypothetical protein